MTDNSKDEKSRKTTTPKKRGRKPGTPKTGGRKKGTPNKNTRNFRVGLDNSGLNVVEQIAVLYNQMEDADKKLWLLKTLLPYVYPRFKETEEIQDEEPTQPEQPKSKADLLSIVNGKQKQ